MASEGGRYLVCGRTPWALDVYRRVLCKLPGEWCYVQHRADLPLIVRGEPRWRYVFFLHWRWRVPAEVLEATECVGLHLGQLPQERGGTPLQWRILEGKRRTPVTMFRMTEEVDAGPVYGTAWIDTGGPAEAVYRRAMEAGARLIRSLVEWPEGYTVLEPQYGEPKVYPRRWDTALSFVQGGPDKLTAAYDQIRCVDAPGYPPAYLLYGGLRFEFRRAVHYGGRVVADVTITEEGGGEG